MAFHNPGKEILIKISNNGGLPVGLMAQSDPRATTPQLEEVGETRRKKQIG